MPITKTPLRYPGGKSQLRPLVNEIIMRSSAEFSEYIEPFCGGAGVAMDLLLKRTVERVWINDLDRGIYSFWYALVNEPTRLIEWVKTVPLTTAEWERQRMVVDEREPVGGYDFELGAAYFYMSRTNRSGVIRGGLIGGRAQSGKYKMDCRFNKPRLIALMQEISAESARIRVTNINGADVLSGDLPPASEAESCLVYADPPYVRKAQGLYMNYFTNKDHVQLRNRLADSSFPYWFATYDNDQLIRDLYSTNVPETIEVTYSAQAKRKESELLIMSAALRSAISAL